MQIILFKKLENLLQIRIIIKKKHEVKQIKQ